jgi:hypothetical protein
MKAEPDDLKISDVLQLKSKQMLVVNPEYQRGPVWSSGQKKKLVDSVLRGYPIPLIYFHHIRQEAGRLISERFEIIDGQQRINALDEFHEGAYKLFDPVKDEAEARFPEFIKKQPCPWGGKSFNDLTDDLKAAFLGASLRIVKIETHESNEARDLFVRLQAGMPLNSQEKRDAWPGQFTDFILRLGGKLGVARYPGHDFFNELMRASKGSDRGKFRQLAAQIAMLCLKRRQSGDLCDTNAQAIDDFYYENLGFDATSADARRLVEILDKLTTLLGDGKRPKIIGHEAIHLVLLVDSLLDDYTRSWEERFAGAFDEFRRRLVEAKKLAREDAGTAKEYWLRYGVGTRVNSDRAETIRARHEFFAAKMYELLKPLMKDPKREFGALEKELIYYRDRKRCGVCDTEVRWDESEFHHVQEHSQGGKTRVDNGVLVHGHCHPKTAEAVQDLERRVRSRLASIPATAPIPEETAEPEDEGDDEDGENDPTIVHGHPRDAVRTFDGRRNEMSGEIAEFATAIGALPLLPAPSGGRSVNYYGIPKGALYIKISRSKKPFWGFGAASKNELDHRGAWYLVLLVSSIEGAVFSRQEVQRFIDQNQWGMREEDQQYKINWPLPDGGTNWFRSPEQFLDKINRV